MNTDLIVRDNDIPDLNERHQDPVIELKRKKLQRLIVLAKRFKRVDIELLQMRSPLNQGMPAFCVHSLEAFERKMSVNFDGNCYRDPINGRERFREVVGGGVFTESGNGVPKSNIPTSARAAVEEYGHNFDDLIVVWDATQEWSVVSNTTATFVGADPLILGSIDGVWLCLAKWDLTKLESYFVS